MYCIQQHNLIINVVWREIRFKGAVPRKSWEVLECDGRLVSNLEQLLHFKFVWFLKVSFSKHWNDSQFDWIMLRTGFAFCSLSGALCICSVCLFPHSWHPVRQSSSTLIESCVPMRGFYNTENVCEYSAPDSSRNLRLTHRTPSACCVPTTKYYLLNININIKYYLFII
jgi:hypothetical protein